MTNREWINSLDDKEFVEIVNEKCFCCVGCNKCSRSCLTGMEMWLKKRHKKEEPTKQEKWG